ncbi:MAG: endonuclease domain-containing protein, partial [Planctomycetota bacterium]|nr:endonuclease domain-containing protein [Planctomycetota bacterium]
DSDCTTRRRAGESLAPLSLWERVRVRVFGTPKTMDTKKRTPSKLLAQCREQRRTPTDAERLLWRHLRNRRTTGVRFRRQHPIGPYILDFYCHEALLAIEVDGGQHNDPSHSTHDNRRAMYLKGKGINVLRFWDKDVLTKTKVVLDVIWSSLTPALSQREREPRSPLPLGEG